MKLEAGMYVRTKWGIAKYITNHITKATIYRVIDRKIVYDNIEDWEDCLLDNEITKASHNIIDLIEVGDYVNGMRIDDIDIHSKRLYREMRYDYEIIDGKEIKSIVTKEQFESISYKLEE